jgi:hypothetical protein
MGPSAYRLPARVVFDEVPCPSRAGLVSAIFLWVLSLGFALFAAAWVVSSSIFSAPDPLSALPVLPALVTAFGAWHGWNKSHARGLRFDLADTIFKTLVVLSVLLATCTFIAFAHQLLYPPPPLNFHFSFGGC